MTGILLPLNTVTIIRGTSKTLQLSVVDADNKVVDLTGARVIMTVKESMDEKTPVFQKTSDVSAQITITTPLGGLAQIYINPADTKDRQIKQYVFDVWVVLASGKRYAVVPPSTFDLQAGVTVLF